jgi:biofilm protein TabA
MKLSGLKSRRANKTKDFMQQTNGWYNSKSWLNGLQLQPHASINQDEFIRQYKKYQERWDKAFKFLKSTSLELLPDCRISILEDDVYASINGYVPKEHDEAKWEAHKTYADIQYIIYGKEKIGVMPLSATSIIEPYNAENDITFLDGTGGEFYLANPGMFFIFFPDDAHRPSIKTEGCEFVKKLVIKVKVD